MFRPTLGALAARLRRHPFPIFWISQTVSLLGLQVGGLAMPLVALTTLNADTRTLSLIAAATTAPWLVFGLLAGVLIDRLPRRAVILIAHFGRVIILISVPIAHLLGLLDIPQLIVVAFVGGILGMLFEIAYHAYLPSTVPTDRLEEANRKLAVTDGAARAGGPALAGWVIQLAGAPFALLVPALGHLVAGLATTLLPAPARSRARLRGRDLPGGLRAIASDRTLRRMVGQETGFLFAFDFSAAAVLVGYTEAGLNAATIGLVLGAGATAGIAGSLTYAPLRRSLGRRRTMRLGALVRAAGLLALVPLLQSGVPAAVAAGGCRAALSFGWAIWDVPRLTIMQSQDPDRLGSINSTALLAARTASLIGALIASLVAPGLGTDTMIIIAGAVAATAAVGYLIRSA